MKLLKELKKRKIINKEEMNEIKGRVRSSGDKLEEVLLQKEVLEEQRLFEIKSEVFDFPLWEGKVKKLPEELLSLIPQESMDFYKMVPLGTKREESVLEVGMVYPENDQGREAVEFLAREQRMKPKIYLITLSDFKKFVEKSQEPEEEMEEALGRIKKEISTEKEKKEKRKGKKLGEEAPVIKMVSVILRQAVEGGASDIHIEPMEDELRVRFRMNGVLYPSLVLPLEIHPAVVARIKILSDLKIDETRIPQGGRFSTVIKGQEIDFRVSTFPTSLGEKVVLRVLNPEEGLKSLRELGFLKEELKKVKEAAKEPYGMILATGPTGCGKTTTLYSLLKRIKSTEVNIVTLEDPVEYVIEDINQSQVKPDIGFTFVEGLRTILRQDPDIIMVGEIRDKETASLAIHAALTGHLVLSTLHTNSAPGTVPRLIDMGVKSFLLPATLNLAIGQRLVRVLCDNCKKKVKLEGEEKEYMGKKIEEIPEDIRKDLDFELPDYIYKPQGCKECNDTGYKGRTGVFEVMKMNKQLRKVIGKKTGKAKLREKARESGMLTIQEGGIIKVLEGITSLEEVMRVTES